ncbi:MAG: hypothetical protein GOVbin3171_12 [Prokaryotic dsDNA virus sp.]|nr:MAG: hypothetical protein GOVbin3171_12 [Prokaryotic dsDNA virus sp.]|tara:strand:+ start:1464 stop:1697 length:234 start_codon:yes stop_codon:yes gene_type:complete
MGINEILSLENKALRKELIELIQLTKESSKFLHQVWEAENNYGEKNDAEYIKLLCDALDKKIFKLKTLVDNGDENVS